MDIYFKRKNITSSEKNECDGEKLKVKRDLFSRITGPPLNVGLGWLLLRQSVWYKLI